MYRNAGKRCSESARHRCEACDAEPPEKIVWQQASAGASEQRPIPALTAPPQPPPGEEVPAERQKGCCGPIASDEDDGSVVGEATAASNFTTRPSHPCPKR